MPRIREELQTGQKEVRRSHGRCQTKQKERQTRISIQHLVAALWCRLEGVPVSATPVRKCASQSQEVAFGQCGLVTSIFEQGADRVHDAVDPWKEVHVCLREQCICLSPLNLRSRDRGAGQQSATKSEQRPREQRKFSGRTKKSVL